MLDIKKKDRLILFLIFLGFLFSCIVGFKYIKKYDINKIENGSLSNSYFFGKEGGTPSFWHEAHELKKTTKEIGYFKSGDKYEFAYLPSKIIYIYYKIINEDIKVYDQKLHKEVFKIDNKKFGLIVLQNFIYFFSILFFIFSIKNRLKNNYFIIVPLISFLCFEPTLNQWNRVLYSESIFFSLQLLTLAILFSYKNDSSYIKSISIGLLISLMYLQRTVSIYYFLIIFLYFYIFFRKKFLINAFLIILLYLTTHFFVGYHNFKRDGEFYFLPIIAKEDLYGYFIPKIIKYNIDPNFVENFITRHDSLNNFVKSNNLDNEKDININDRLDIAKINMSKGFNLIINYPIASIKEYIISLAHFLLLKPNEMYFLFENKAKYNNQFFFSKDFKAELPYKVMYSIFIYSISFMGFLYFIKKKDFKTIFILLGSILYFVLPVAWHKQSSYLAPILIYTSTFFGAGIYNLNLIFKKLKNDR